MVCASIITFDAEDVESIFDALDRFACAMVDGDRTQRLEAAAVLQSTMQHLRAKHDLAEGPAA